MQLFLYTSFLQKPSLTDSVTYFVFVFNLHHHEPMPGMLLSSHEVPHLWDSLHALLHLFIFLLHFFTFLVQLEFEHLPLHSSRPWHGDDGDDGGGEGLGGGGKGGGSDGGGRLGEVGSGGGGIGGDRSETTPGSEATAGSETTPESEAMAGSDATAGSETTPGSEIRPGSENMSGIRLRVEGCCSKGGKKGGEGGD